MTVLQTIEFEGAAKSTLYDSKEGTGDLDAIVSWEGGGIQHAGNYALRHGYWDGVAAAYGFYVLALGSAVPNLWVETYYRQAAAVGGSVWLKSGSWELDMIRSDQKFRFNGITGSLLYNWGSWVKFTINATPTRFRLWVDGVLDIDTATINTPGAAVKYGYEQLGPAGPGAHHWLDDYLKVADAPFSATGVAFRLVVS